LSLYGQTRPTFKLLGDHVVIEPIINFRPTVGHSSSTSMFLKYNQPKVGQKKGDIINLTVHNWRFQECPEKKTALQPKY